MTDVGPAPGPRGGRRAPRLGPDERIAAHITRTGRFRAVDPTKGRPLPGIVRVLGALGWVVLLGESFRRALARRGER